MDVSLCLYWNNSYVQKFYQKSQAYFMDIVFCTRSKVRLCEEVYEFFKIKNKWTTVNKEIVNFITEYLSDIKHNYTISDRVLIQNISVGYGSNQLLENISFSDDMFNSNNYTILMGNNGSGKSSLCRILEGIYSHVILNRNANSNYHLKKLL